MTNIYTPQNAKESHLPFSVKLSYGLGDYLNTMTYAMIGAFLMPFLTDVLLIPIGFVTALMAISKLWDAINDPIVGVLVDKSRSRWGVYRPWILFVSVPLACVAIAMWAPISHWSESAKIIYVSAAYCLYTVVFTAHHIAYGSLAGAITLNTDERGKLNGFRLANNQIMRLVLLTFFLPYINFLSNQFNLRIDRAYCLAAATLIIPGILCAVNLFKRTKEVVLPPKSNKLPFSDLTKFVFQNPSLLLCMFGQLVMGIYMVGRDSVMLYFFRYAIQNEALYPFYSFISVGCAILGPITAPLIMEKLGNKGRVVTIGALGAGIFYVIMFFINPVTNSALFFTLAGISGYLSGMIYVSLFACTLDTVEYGQLKTGIRASAVAVSMCHFSNKVGMTLSTAGVGAILGYLGFVPNVMQNGQVVFWIRSFFTWAPGVVGIVLGLIFLFYKLDRDTYYKVLGQIEQKK